MILNNNRDHNSDTDIYTEKTQRCLEYIDSLEEERRKIQVFQRELPLCLDLVSLAIEKCRKEISCGGQSEEYTSRKRPVFEEFIPMKNMSSLSREEEEGDICREKNIPIGNNCSNDNKSSLKSDWLTTSLQLWKHAPNQEELAKEVAVQKNGSGGGFQRERSVGSSAKPQQVKVSMTAESGGGGGSCGGNCKRRRSWSPELHRRFVAAVEQLGGVLVATPKKIREKMKVDGLTTNEIKSHLQKYRLHARASTPETQNPCSHVQAVPQFVVLGGLWIPPPEHAPTAAAATTSASGEGAEATSTPPDEIYAPKAARPKPPSA